jgi:hypothetical protein
MLGYLIYRHVIKLKVKIMDLIKISKLGTKIAVLPKQRIKAAINMNFSFD